MPNSLPLPLPLQMTLKLFYERVNGLFVATIGKTDPRLDFEKSDGVGPVEAANADITALLLSTKELWSFALALNQSGMLSHGEWAQVEIFCQKMLKHIRTINPEFMTRIQFHRENVGVVTTF